MNDDYSQKKYLLTFCIAEGQGNRITEARATEAAHGF
ncbi:MAG: hypothetical protein JWP81_3019 [Ferruginibacter sp.]|nr:hypothetical protein [Ferruginibacter sp.]